MEHAHDGLGELDLDECMEFLRHASFGRIGLLIDGLPVVVPLTFRMRNDHLVVRTVRGTKLAAATRNAIVAFEVDEVDSRGGYGWSIMVSGVAREIVEPATAETGRDPSSVLDERLVRISLDVVTGRRLVPDLASALADAGAK